MLVAIIAFMVRHVPGINALIKKNGADAAVALVSLATAPLTPFFSAEVLLVVVLVRRTAARSAGTPRRQPAA
ncbi:hypothetical protein SAMN04488564_12428 [Lentzea waywayandensis]|uniref:Uncharacterized protein n=1 Tax=Lentzea waywayandensis TaxID=84724 RepID=A0A1I6FJ24_9PSEU|nr:hypothetical protein [Lentzea waywayandensis]SFR29935.1 hypothetical protein SAMN04488564_12428 [Lentzea waywayandensis]